jgi:2'-5' RNA ligase
MDERFLTVERTIAFEDRDFVEWHGGVQRYGFWAVPVVDAQWCALFRSASAHVAGLIDDGYDRAPHVTIAACGLLDPAYFSDATLQRQMAALSAVVIAPFSLHAGALDSFTTGPYIALDDPAGVLHQLRRLLATVVSEDSPASYRPHLTLGFYRGVLSTTAVADHLSGFEWPSVASLRVQEIAFCSYECYQAQGPYNERHRLQLSQDGLPLWVT